MFKTIKVNGHELMTCYESNDGLFLHHLNSPENNKGFGKLGLAVFYVIAKIKGYTKFTMKFGGGEQSKQFLLKIGFKEENIKLVQDTDYVGLSVVVGQIESTGRFTRENKPCRRPANIPPAVREVPAFAPGRMSLLIIYLFFVRVPQCINIYACFFRYMTE